MNKGTVLVVDDDPITLEVARERLEGAGYQVHVRDQALGTTEFIAKNRPDIVLMDVMMPGLSGDKLAELLQRQDRTRQVPVILHSSKESADLDEMVERAGILGAITKTSDDDAFLAQFQRLAAQARLQGTGQKKA
jgi:CheY-like chemotaxis protein